MESTNKYHSTSGRFIKKKELERRTRLSDRITQLNKTRNASARRSVAAMGQTTSNIVKRVVSPLWGGGRSSSDGSGSKAVTPFVFKRRGSQYFDEDGDLAHEFYEEVKDRRNRRTTMRKKSKKYLVPQGEVDLPIPRLHVDFPIVICEVPIR